MKNATEKKSFLLRLAIMTGLGFVLSISSCNDDSSEFDEETILEETAFAENVFTDITNDAEAMSNLVVEGGRMNTGEESFPTCVTRTLQQPEEGNFPKVVTINYAPDCEFTYGRQKEGTLEITLTGHLDETGSQMIIKYIDFYINGYKIEGTHIRTRNSPVECGFVLENGKITTPEGKEFTRSANRVRTMTAGMETIITSDDEFETTGSSSGFLPSGVSYSKTITTPLVSARNCPWIKSGVVETITENQNRLLDFGDGECDNLAVLTVNGESEEITMDFRMKHRKIRRLHR
jgi:hypothetical protein